MSHLGWFLYLLVAMAFWASIYPLMKMVEGLMDPLLMGFLRSFFAAVVLLPILLKSTRFSLPPRKEWPHFFILGLLTVIPTPLLLLALHYTNTTASSILINTNPLWIALLAPLFIGERFHLKHLGALFLGFIGMVLTILNGHLPQELISSDHFIGSLILLLAAFSVVGYTMLGKRFFARYGGFYVTTLNFTIGAILMFFLSFISGSVPQLLEFSAQTWLYCFLIGLFSTAIPFVMWSNSMKHLKSSTAASFKFFIPIFTAIYAVVFLHETLTVWIVSGLALTGIGVWAVNREERLAAVANSQEQ